VLSPVGSANPAAPDSLLELIFCNCKMGCKTLLQVQEGRSCMHSNVYYMSRGIGSIRLVHEIIEFFHIVCVVCENKTKAA
jgi:hypothetical protein